jgi:hypothetical protein
MDYSGGFTKKNLPDRPPAMGSAGPESSIKWLVLLIGAIILAMAAFFIITRPGDGHFPLHNGEKTSSTSTSPDYKSLPDDLGVKGQNGNGAYGLDELKAEDLTFGYFYKKPEDDDQKILNQYELPLNIKIDVSNYYDFSRRIDISYRLEELNEFGFAIMADPFGATDQFDFYRQLSKNEIPSVLTTDFLVYYFQNVFKEAYSNIKKNAFYENVWDITKELYNTSQARYKKTSGELGLDNDLAMEGQRLETVFFAVALELLKPLPEQINIQANLNDDNKFTERDADHYDYLLLESIKDDVKREVALIREAKQFTKSPVFLYGKNYADFTVPPEFRQNAKLKNFYLATKWYNSNFPLYYRSEECEACHLDSNDWKINFAAANYISRDLYENQKAKNQWAVIYKFISFFSGLRSDLTYLHYYRSFADLFGDAPIAEVFSLENERIDDDLGNLRAKILEYEFLPMEGVLDREAERTSIGMRLLQDDYWPNSFIFENMTGLDMVINSKKSSATSCRDRRTANNYRCLGSGFDIANLFYPVKGNLYFEENKDYANYEDKLDYLKRQIGEFDQNTWNSNFYWLNMDLAKSIFDPRLEEFPYSTSEEWRQNRGVNTLLGSWANLHLAADKQQVFIGKNESKLNLAECNEYNYIEPNRKLVREMMAKNRMLMDMLVALGVTNTTNFNINNLMEMEETLARIDDIIGKEYEAEKLDDDECKFLESLLTSTMIEQPAPKTVDLRKKGGLVEDIRGQKMIVLIYERGGKNIMAAGPIFNFMEK